VLDYLDPYLPKIKSIRAAIAAFLARSYKNNERYTKEIYVSQT
jgi:hypothetical protein